MDPEIHDEQQRILNCVIEDQSVLYAAFMPFLENGGVFVSTE